LGPLLRGKFSFRILFKKVVPGLILKLQNCSSFQSWLQKRNNNRKFLIFKRLIDDPAVLGVDRDRSLSPPWRDANNRECLHQKALRENDNFVSRRFNSYEIVVSPPIILTHTLPYRPCWRDDQSRFRRGSDSPTAGRFLLAAGHNSC